MAVFKENLTSRILQDTAIKLVKSEPSITSILEIGCGDANISQAIWKSNQKLNFFCSDISEEAINKGKKNLQNIKNFNFKVGNLFEPWQGKKFDLIISDVPSISNQIAKDSDWYKGVMYNTGLNGLKTIELVLQDVLNFLNKGGFFLLPIISLCDVINLKENLEKQFTHVEYCKEIRWPLPTFFQNNIKYYENLKKKKIIDISESFGILTAFTYAAVCKT